MPKGVFQVLTCDICSKGIKSNAFSRHCRSCKGPVERKKRKAWNKGLTIESDSRLSKMGDSISKVLKGRKGHPLSKEQKENLSALQSERLRKGYANGTREQAGGFCKWFEVEGVKVQGTWEFRTAKILSNWKQSGRINSWERCSHRITYTFNGKQHTYSPDFLVTRSDGSSFILEVKGRQSIVDDIKWNAARASFDFVVWRLKDIQHYEEELTRRRS